MQNNEEVVVINSSGEGSDCSEDILLTYAKHESVDGYLDLDVSKLEIDTHTHSKGVKLSNEQRVDARLRSGRARSRSISSSVGSHQTGGKSDKLTDLIVKQQRAYEESEKLIAAAGRKDISTGVVKEVQSKMKDSRKSKIKIK